MWPLGRRRRENSCRLSFIKAGEGDILIFVIFCCCRALLWDMTELVPRHSMPGSFTDQIKQQREGVTNLYRSSIICNIVFTL